MTIKKAAKKLVTRSVTTIPPELHHLPPVLQRVFAARGITCAAELQRNLSLLPSPWLLSGMEKITDLLMTAIVQQQKIVIVADYDADGATSCAIAMQGLKQFGLKNCAFVVPNRFQYAYGLSPEIVLLVKELHPDVEIILTVDNGTSDTLGINTAKQLGLCVLVTDHHLPHRQLPDADAIVNPCLPHSEFPSTHLAGCGVIFYVLMALRAKMRSAGHFQKSSEPNLTELLDYVALGTVADVVRLDAINRSLVHQGLLRIRAGKCHAGILALLKVAGKNSKNLTTTDLGFALAPRLNAAGRMDDMSLGIQCLLTEDAAFAEKLAQQLNQLNSERKEVEAQMKQEALLLLADAQRLDKTHLLSGVCLYDASWHQGVIGILAARMKEQLHRPVIAFAPAGQDEIKGSARSIEGIHIRDVLSDIAAAHPSILSKFGGHAMAAGLSLKMHDYPVFVLAFDEMVSKRLQGMDLHETMLTDGQLTAEDFTLSFAQTLQNSATWGQGFPEPVFEGYFDVVQCRVLAQLHLKFVLKIPNSHALVDAIVFFVEQPESWLHVKKIRAAYKLSVNEYKEQCSLQLQLLYLEKQ